MIRNTVRSRRVASTLALSALCAGMSLFVVACEESSAPNKGITISEIQATPQNYIGQKVTVNGTVQQVLGTGVFTIAQTGGGGNAKPLIVFGSEKYTKDKDPVAQGRAVSVKGTVRLLNQQIYEQEARKEIGKQAPAWDSAMFGQYEGQPTIIASSVSKEKGETGTAAEQSTYRQTGQQQQPMRSTNTPSTQPAR